MRILIAGATGVIGRPLVALLLAAGHDVTALSRRNPLDGVASMLVDALDQSAVAQAVSASEPDVIVNLLSAIPASINPRRMDRDFALTNRLRDEGTRNLVTAAAGARLICAGVAFAYVPGDGLADETTPLWPKPARQFRAVLAAVHSLEEQTYRAGGLVLRFGHLYGPGSAFADDGSMLTQIRAGRFPVVGAGGAVFSFISAQDSAAAVLAAIDRPTVGAINIVDDDPAPVSEWLPTLARLLDAPNPKRIPAWAARLVVGGWGADFMTRLRGADNARARVALDWRPRDPSWRDGFAQLQASSRSAK